MTTSAGRMGIHSSACVRETILMSGVEVQHLSFSAAFFSAPLEDHSEAPYLIPLPIQAVQRSFGPFTHIQGAVHQQCKNSILQPGLLQLLRSPLRAIIARPSAARPHLSEAVYWLDPQIRRDWHTVSSSASHFGVSVRYILAAELYVPVPLATPPQQGPTPYG